AQNETTLPSGVPPRGDPAGAGFRRRTPHPQDSPGTRCQRRDAAQLGQARRDRRGRARGPHHRGEGGTPQAAPRGEDAAPRERDLKKSDRLLRQGGDRGSV
ncbi:MAG: hypothetical protein AVDCRST_MAG22-919, partial [uncultured Rubrobacteraceae bacterium]